jgi:hypothetical protein
MSEGRQSDGIPREEGAPKVMKKGGSEDARADGDRSHEKRGSRDSDERAAAEHGTSFPSVIFGWLASLGAAPILTGIIGAVVGGIVALAGLGATGGGIAGAAGFLVTLFLVFLIGGYVAGRLAGRSGAKHGIFVALLALLAPPRGGRRRRTRGV